MSEPPCPDAGPGTSSPSSTGTPHPPLASGGEERPILGGCEYTSFWALHVKNSGSEPVYQFSDRLRQRGSTWVAVADFPPSTGVRWRTRDSALNTDDGIGAVVRVRPAWGQEVRLA